MLRAFKNKIFPWIAKEKQLQIRSDVLFGSFSLQILLETLLQVIMVYRLALLC